jgi:hypothetical protein
MVIQNAEWRGTRVAMVINVRKKGERTERCTCGDAFGVLAPAEGLADAIQRECCHNLGHDRKARLSDGESRVEVVRSRAELPDREDGTPVGKLRGGVRMRIPLSREKKRKNRRAPAWRSV